MSKGSVYLYIPGIGRVIAIWDEVFFKLRVYFDGLVIRKEVFSESSHRIETHIDVVKEVLEIQSSISFEFCLYEELVEFWWSGLMFEGPHATNFGRVSPFQWWIPPVSRDHGGRVWSSRCILLGWWLFINVSLIHHECCENFEGFCDGFHLIFHLLFVFFRFWLAWG